MARAVKKGLKARLPYWDIVKRSAGKYKVPAEIIYSIIEIESNFIEKAYRYEAHIKDASYGLMQILSSTAREFGLSGKPELLFDPQINIDIGTRYLSWLYSKYGEIKDEDQRWFFAIGAYNAGRGNINKMLVRARQYESQLRHNVITIDDEGVWQNWWWSSRFLKDITGDNAKVTERYIIKLAELIKKYQALIYPFWQVVLKQLLKTLKKGV